MKDVIGQGPINRLHGLEWSTEDVYKRYRHVYIFGSIAGAPGQVVYLDDSGERGAFHVRTKAHPNGDSVPLELINLLEDRPEPCISNVGDKQAVIFQYRPKRQWRRGICHDNSKLQYPPFEEELLKKRVPPSRGVMAKGQKELVDVGTSNAMASRMSISYNDLHLEAVDSLKSDAPIEGLQWDELTAIFQPKYTPFGDALTQLSKSEGSRAINNDYMLVNLGEHVSLYRHEALLGHFLGKKFFYSKPGRCLHQELYEELPQLKDFL